MTRWIDTQGDVWEEGDDGLLHTPETRPFPREHVERKWGPLRQVHDCGHVDMVAGCGGCDPSAIELVITHEGRVVRPFDPERDFAPHYLATWRDLPERMRVVEEIQEHHRRFV